MAFRFPLATVLRFRESVEEREELVLEKIAQEIVRTRMQIEQQNTEIALTQSAVNQSLRQPVAAFHLQSMLSDINTVVNRKKALIESLVLLEQQREAQMKTYQAAHRARQMLSEVAGRLRSAHDLEQTRKQQRVLDDIFAARAQRS